MAHLRSVAHGGSAATPPSLGAHSVEHSPPATSARAASYFQHGAGEAAIQPSLLKRSSVPPRSKPPSAEHLGRTARPSATSRRWHLSHHHHLLPRRLHHCTPLAVSADQTTTRTATAAPAATAASLAGRATRRKSGTTQTPRVAASAISLRCLCNVCGRLQQ